MTRMRLWWRTRKWKPEDHDDCMSFMGPCNLCRERMEYVRLRESPELTRWQRLMLRLTPHETEVTESVWGAGSGTRIRCTVDACSRDCKNLQRRLRYAFPQARLVSKGWEAEVVQKPPCDPECRAFGPCSDCTVMDACIKCGKVGHCPHRCAMHTHCDECDGPLPFPGP